MFDATNSTNARRNMLMKLAEGKCKVNSLIIWFILTIRGCVLGPSCYVFSCETQEILKRVKPRIFERFQSTLYCV